MDLSNYYPAHFITDTQILKDSGIDCQCNRIWNKIYKEEIDLKLTSMKFFVLCSYELNLIDQIFYNYFKNIHTTWKSNIPHFIDCRCTYSNHPFDILSYAKSNAKRINRKLDITTADILEVDKLFLNEISNSENFKINIEALKTAISNDPDCNLQQLLNSIK